MSKGKRVEPSKPLPKIRERFQEEFAMLDEEYKKLKDPSPFPVHLSSGLKKLQEQVSHEVREKELGES